MRYFLDLAYDGTAFCGWQRQPTGVRTVQQVVEEALTMLLKQPMEIIGAGRTDTGVHARQQVAHFDVDEPVADPAVLLYRLARLLPADVKPRALVPVAAHYHARFSATARTYYYDLHWQPDPFRRFFSTFVSALPDFAAMNAAAALLLGEHDFTTFSKTGGTQHHFRCTIMQARWDANEAAGEARFTIEANRFLRGQVRLLVGTLLDVGRGRRAIADVGASLAAQDRTRSAGAAPATGLALARIQYPGLALPASGAFR